MPSNDALKASPQEMKKRQIDALMRERVGYERRLLAAAGEPDPDRRADLERDAQRRIDEVNDQLRHFGVQGAAPSKRAERRPVSARAEQR